MNKEHLLRAIIILLSVLLIAGSFKFSSGAGLMLPVTVSFFCFLIFIVFEAYLRIQHNIDRLKIQLGGSTVENVKSASGKNTINGILKKTYYFLMPPETLPMEIFLSLKRKLTKGRLPDFIIIGAVKAGTSSLWKNLKQHPDIQMASKFLNRPGKNEIERRKEVNFFTFDYRWYRGKTWYASMFDDNEKLQGEASPKYFHSQICHQRMHETVPGAKLILLLRDPVKRAFSEFNHMVERKKLYGGEKIPTENFSEFLDMAFCRGDEKAFALIKRGFYIDQIESLLKYYPRNQLLVLISEQMNQNPQEAYDRVFDFLQVKKITIRHIKGVNSRSYREPLSIDDGKRLKEIYATYNERLFAYLGYKIKEWEKI